MLRKSATIAALLAVALCGEIAPRVRAQSAPASRFGVPDEAFEIASVKANRSGGLAWDFDSPPGRVVGTNVVLRDLIRFAYYIYGGDWDIRIAAPEWIKTARYDIDARTPGPVSQERAMSMLRHLLAARFGLRIHYENREMPVYALVVARSDGAPGPQLQRSSMDCAQMAAAMQKAKATGAPLPFGPAAPGQRPVCGTSGGPGHSLAGAMTMEQLALALVRDVGRPVLNRTGLAGAWDWELKWTPAPQSADSTRGDEPSIFTALQEQLGLKLEPARGPVEVLVIDAVREPNEN